MRKPSAFVAAFLFTLAVTLVPVTVFNLSQPAARHTTRAENSPDAVLERGNAPDSAYEYNVLLGIQTRDPVLYLRAGSDNKSGQ